MPFTSLKIIIQKVNPTDFLLKPWCDLKRCGEPSAGYSRLFHNTSPSSMALPFSKHLPGRRQGGDGNRLENLSVRCCHSSASVLSRPPTILFVLLCADCQPPWVRVSLGTIKSDIKEKLYCDIYMIIFFWPCLLLLLPGLGTVQSSVRHGTDTRLGAGLASRALLWGSVTSQQLLAFGNRIGQQSI